MMRASKVMLSNEEVFALDALAKTVESVIGLERIREDQGLFTS
jgi:hypothetical protein